jgi:hypothetical protein
MSDGDKGFNKAEFVRKMTEMLDESIAKFRAELGDRETVVGERNGWIVASEDCSWVLSMTKDVAAGETTLRPIIMTPKQIGAARLTQNEAQAVAVAWNSEHPDFRMFETRWRAALRTKLSRLISARAECVAVGGGE